MTARQKHNIIQSFISIILILGTGIVILSSQFLFIRKISEFSVHIMLGMLAFSMLTMMINKKRIMFAGLACTAALCIFLKDASNNTLKLPVANRETNLKVAHINLSNITYDINSIVDFIESEEAEIVSFQELTPNWDASLNQVMSALYPHRKQEVRIDPYGMALYSKYPLIVADTFQCNGIPYLNIAIEKEENSFEIISSYLTPALDQISIASASEELETIAKKVKKCKHPVIALGEFNMVYWTNEIREFRSETNLTNSRRGLSQGNMNLRVPYDHIFFSSGLECTNFKEVKDKDENYLGIVGTYQIKNPEPNPTLNSQLSLNLE